jgi:alpha-L-arabinofuranosidase
MRYATEWGDQFFPAAGHDTDYYSIHYYEPGDSMKGEFAAEYFQRAAMVIAENLERKLGGVFNVMAKHQVKIPIALDEWRLSVPGNTPLPVWLDVPESTTMEQVGSMGSASSMLSAVSEATIFNLMQRHPAELRMSNRTLLYAYLGGTLGINREHVVSTPTALMMEMYATRDRCRSLAVDVQGDTFDVPSKAGFQGVQHAPYIDVSVRQHPDGRVDVFLVNRNLVDSISARIAASGGAPPAQVEITTLASEKITDWNTFENPTRVAPRTSAAAASDGKIAIDLPPHSVTSNVDS